MTKRFSNSVALSTFRANGDLIDYQEFDGLLSAFQTIAEDVVRFREVWERGESYHVFVNNILVEEGDNFND